MTKANVNPNQRKTDSCKDDNLNKAHVQFIESRLITFAASTQQQHAGKNLNPQIPNHWEMISGPVQFRQCLAPLLRPLRFNVLQVKEPFAIKFQHLGRIGDARALHERSGEEFNVQNDALSGSPGSHEISALRGQK